MPDSYNDSPRSPQAASRATHNTPTVQDPPPPTDVPSSTSNLPPPPSSSNMPARSHPMSASTSSSSHTSLKDPNQSSTAAPSPYGTRSRNRTGGLRPNYAEDKESEMEYEYTNSSTKTNPPANSQPTLQPQSQPQQPDTSRQSGVNTRRTAVNTPNAVPAAGDEAALGTKTSNSSLSAAAANSVTNGVAPVSKKRKAGHLSTAPSSSSPTTSVQAITRRASQAAATHDLSSNIMTFETCQGRLHAGLLVADDGTSLAIDDHVYLICEPPGEPYYLGRIMEFLHKQGDSSNPVDTLRVNWYYRPRDIQRKVTDSRVVFASMHSDTCPLTSLRGKCHITHRAEITDIDEYRKRPNSFWYEKMFDRYIHRYYEVIPTSQVINVPEHVKKVLDERWKYLIVEIGRGKELTSAVKLCKRCSQYCASNDSVGCAVCRATYHMNCVSPPLQKKPSRGFAWACAPCSRAQERKLEARNTPIVREVGEDGDEDEIVDDLIDDDDAHAARAEAAQDAEEKTVALRPATAEQLAHSKMWPYRYLGIHCRVEDALDYDDRIYPRASSRLGPRHQANVNVWHGRPIEYVKAAEIKKKYVKGGGHKKDTKLSKDTLAALEADKQAKERRPKWVLDEPAGFIRRGEDKPNGDAENTATLQFRLPQVGEKSSRGENDLPWLSGQSDFERELLVSNYMNEAKKLAPSIGLEDGCTNFLDKALELLYSNAFNTDKALWKIKSLKRRKDLKEPEFSEEEVKRFEEGVSKFGSELHSVARHVRTQKEADVVRFYYLWKKGEKGAQIWANFEGRKGKKETKRSIDPTTSKLLDDVADDHDDSAFDHEKAVRQSRTFKCKFCLAKKSRKWRRAPGVPPGTTVPAESNGKSQSKDKGQRHVLALCQRCAEMWRKYGIQWEELDEVMKKVAQGGGKAWKRRIDEEQLKEITKTPEPEPESPMLLPATTSVPPAQTAASTPTGNGEPAKKKTKISSEKEPNIASTNGNSTATAQAKKRLIFKVEKSPSPEIPKPIKLPCSVCEKVSPGGEEYLTCRECRLAVHRSCYGVSSNRSSSKWICDTCANDKNPQVSNVYRCTLCPRSSREYKWIDQSKPNHKKKNDKDKDKVDCERQLAAADFYTKKQEELNRPINPREPLKRTAGNNWAHVTCAIFLPEIKFGNAQALEPLEGIGGIPAEYFGHDCDICLQKGGACMPCQHCSTPMHVSCNLARGGSVGFLMATARGARKEHQVKFNGEIGVMQVVYTCLDHREKDIIEFNKKDTETGQTAMQVYAETFKQANLTLTGTVRKANFVREHTKLHSRIFSTPGNGHTANGANGIAESTSRGRHDEDQTSVTSESHSEKTSDKKSCDTCGIRTSPKWYPLIKVKSPTIWMERSGQRLDPDAMMKEWNKPRVAPILTNGIPGNIPNKSGLQCHRCHISRAADGPGQRTSTATVPTQPISNPPFPSTYRNGHLPSTQHIQVPPQPQSQPRVVPTWGQELPDSFAPGFRSIGGSIRNPDSSAQRVHQMPPQPPAIHSHGSSASPPVYHNGLPPTQPLGMSTPQRTQYLPPRPMSDAQGAPPPPMAAQQQQHMMVSGQPQQPHPSFGTPHGSPRNSREGLTGSRAPSEGRTPGGASESPSLRNLLH
ncbi:MAG: putative PHD type zinc finger protein with BAH domain-containing protein [Vezdaea aestivalis]|nr:MAG: putative PHD type zinc finger protein with BAH domain-containing protein [Vezdaea aestivalis]